ncbi:MAG TPA: hypothetical protein VG454_16345 [Gemmatimonadales bacterium]|nr:hypothetical protein [Gemmatimonadales bacterium]
MISERFRYLAVVAWCGAACKFLGSGEPQFPGTRAQGIVTGLVSDSAGHRVADAAMCTTTVVDGSGTPTVVVSYGTTDNAGTYVVPVNLSFKADVRASLAVAATPSLGSGLAPAYQSGLSVLISSTFPPGETTHVNLVAPVGVPFDGRFCVHGP